MLAPRSLLLALLVLLPLGCGKVQSTIVPSDADKFNKEWDALRELGFKPTHAVRPPGPATELLFEDLAALTEMMEAGPMGELALQEPPMRKAELSKWLQDLEPVFEGISKMLDRPEVQAAIQGGESLAQRPSLRLSLDPPNRFASLPLPVTLRLIRPLCQRAIYCSLAEADNDGCVRNLVQALDLIQLLDDGSLISLKRSAILGSEVLKALQILLPRSKLAPDFLRAQIEPRLALASQPSRLELTMGSETSYRMGIGRSVVLTPELPSNEFGLKYLGCKAEEAVDHCIVFSGFFKSIRNKANICNLVAQETARGVLVKDLGAIEEYHNFEIACHLARMALALNEHEWLHGRFPAFLNELEGFAGARPASPCSSKRVDYSLDYNGMRLVSSDRSARTPDTDIPLHRWLWSKNDLSNLNARR